MRQTARSTAYGAHAGEVGAPFAPDCPAPQNALENGKIIAESLKIQNALAEKKNALLAYKIEECDSPEVFNDRAEYIPMIGSALFVGAYRKHNVAQRGLITSFNTIQTKVA